MKGLDTLQWDCWNVVVYLGGFNIIVKFQHVETNLCGSAQSPGKNWLDRNVGHSWCVFIGSAVFYFILFLFHLIIPSHLSYNNFFYKIKIISKFIIFMIYK